MKFTVYQKRVTIVALHECGQTAKQIAKTLRKLPVNERFIFCTFQRCYETDDVDYDPQKNHSYIITTLNKMH